MNGVIFAETLRRKWRATLYWAIGIGVYAMYILMVFGGDDSARAQMADIMATKLPGFLGTMFGIPDDVAFLMTNEGFFGFGYFTYASMLIAVWAVLAGLSITANDEDSGVMNMLLALPVPRWRVLIERALAHMLLLVFILAGGYVGTAAAMQIFPALAMSHGALLAANVALWLLVSAVLCITALLGALIKRRSTAAALAGGFVAASYLLNTIAGAAKSGLGDALRSVSIYRYFNSAEVMREGLTLGSTLVLALVIVGALWFATQSFQRRDIGG